MSAFLFPATSRSFDNESCASLSRGDQERLAHLLRSYSDVFSTGPTDLGRTDLVHHDILTTPGPPVKQQPRRMARDKQTPADQQVQQSLDTGVAQPSNSGWAAPIIMVRKKDQTMRLCVDYRPLNERTIKDAYPLPRIQDTLDTLSTARYFSTLDLTSGYWQVEMTPRARKAAAFCTPRKGLFEWNVMPFGLCNAPATFQRLMDRVLAGLQWETCLVYLDDIIVLGRDGTEMLERLSQVFGRLRAANLKLKPSKCVLFREQVAYLGHIVSAKGFATDTQKIQKVAGWPVPQNISEVRQFVGLASYYRRFVKDFASIAKPLHELTKKYTRFNWTSECQEAFQQLKSRLTSAPVLGYPLDSGKLFLVVPKCQYDKNICRVQHKVGDAVWFLVKGTKRVKNKVRKFLPSYEGPYFVVGVLDDLVYRIKRGPRTKMKVVHHDKLKAYHSRTALDNDWVFQEDETWAPVEVPSPMSDPSSSEIDIGPLDLWGTSPETEDPVVGSLPGLFSLPPLSPASSSSNRLPSHLPFPLDEAREQGARPLSNATPKHRPGKVRRAPDRFGEWIDD